MTRYLGIRSDAIFSVVRSQFTVDTCFILVRSEKKEKKVTNPSNGPVFLSHMMGRTKSSAIPSSICCSMSKRLRAQFFVHGPVDRTVPIQFIVTTAQNRTEPNQPPRPRYPHAPRGHAVAVARTLNPNQQSLPLYKHPLQRSTLIAAKEKALAQILAS